MKPINFSALALRLRLAATALGPVFCLACALIAVGAAALAWLLPQRALQAERHRNALRVVSMPAVASAVLPVATSDQNLALFYATLGEQRYAEQQVKTLFALAGKASLSLSQGEYKSAYDRNANLHTYQVTLPVKGTYGQVWSFGLMALRSIPYASLDELSFKRENIGDAQLEARLRLTLYLSDQGGAR
ncbi:hypothetical protein [Massilia sp. TSP1-1-2]|uniref:hypothetical protein n=1 Tax=unclassified Massilia TaxID=2609279 RepID=UPI003CFB3BCB